MPVARKDEERSSELRSSVSTLDLSERGLRLIEPLPDGISPQTLLYNHNNISRIENLQYFAHLQQLSLADNHLVEMKGISQAQGLKVLDLSNNSIISIEGLTHLRSLEWLNLSGNSIKRVQNIEKNINLYHLDLSDNSIVKICNLRNLMKLKTLLLHGNLVSSIKNIIDNVHESSLVTLSLAENEISDLNEITSLKVLTSLEQLSIAGNQCLLALSNVIGFNYRPFILFNCPRLHNLDAHLISQADRLECEKLRSEGQLRTFSPGRHLLLVKYLTQATPLRQSKTPTPTIDSISSSTQAERWSEPVLDDKPSTEARDLDVEDVTESEFLDELVSESCYLPITVSSIMSSHGDPSSDNLEDWCTSDAYKTSEAVAHSNQDEIYHKRDVIPEERNVGIPVDSIPDGEKNGIQQPVVPGNEEEVDTALMTEEEALNLIHLAATIIQAHVRGFLVRRTLHFYEYRHKKQAATLIQAVWRGYRTRAYNIKVITARNEIRARRLTTHVNHLASLVVQCQEQASRDKRTMAKAIKCLWNELEKQNSRYVTWLQNQQNRAALKIQRFWKGYKVRKLYPRTKSTSVTSCQSLAVICQSLQKQVDLLKDQMEELKSEKSNRDDKSCAEEQTDSSNAEDKSSRSIPAIRITRPSVCILPELQLDASTKEHLKMRESILDDVDVEIEPLDIGEYEGSDQDVCNTTFDVETSAFETTTNEKETNAVRELENDVKDTDDFTESFDAYSKDIAVARQPAKEYNVQENIDSQKEECIEDFKSLSLDDNGTCSKSIETKPDIPKEPGPTPGKEGLAENESELEPTSSYESNEDLVSTVKKVEINVASDGLVDKCVETTKQDKIVYEESRDGDYVTPAFNDIFDKSNADNNASVTNDECVTLEREVTGSADDQIEKNNSISKQTLEREVTGSADDQSEKNNSISKQKSEEHTDFSETTSPSIQADVSLSSDTSVSDSSASPSKLDTSSGRKKKKLLLRSTSAETSPRLRTLHSSPSLDAQQLSSSLNFDSRLSQRSASLLRELRTEIASLTVRQLSDTDYFENQNTTEKSAHSTGSLTGSQTNHPTSDTFGRSPRVPRYDRDNEKRHGTLNRDDPIGGISDKITTTLSGHEVEQGGQGVEQGAPESETTPDGEENAVEDHTKADESSQPSARQTYFTLPAFEDVEASLSMEDFMNDSLEGQCDDHL